MKINKIKINAYGNIEDKEIELKDGINIIHGANESGKSTLLSYIVNTFYGISKNKEGKEISDFDKYKPWNNSEFSGRIGYELDNGEKYEVFKDFKKKNPIIYNDKLEDITNQFEMDKKDGSKFFLEQTGVDKQMYLSTVVSMQQEVRLDEKNQNILIQKIANLAGTGEDNVSYKKALTKLQEKIREEIGTGKTTQKPINILEKEIAEINKKIEEIKPFQDKKYNIDNEKEEINKELEELELEKAIILELKNSSQEENDYVKELDIKEKNKEDNIKQIENLQNKEKELEKQINTVQINIKQLENNIKNKKQEQENIEEEITSISNINDTDNINNAQIKGKTNFIYIIIAIILAILGIITIIFKTYAVTGIIGILFIIDILLLINKSKKQIKYQKEIQEKQDEIKRQNIANKEKLEQDKNIIEKEISSKLEELKSSQNIERELTSQSSMIKGQILLLEKSNEQINIELKNIKEKLQNISSNQKDKIFEKYKEKLDEQTLNYIIEKANLQNNLNKLEEKINNEKIKLKGLEIEEKTVIPQLDYMVNLEEKLQSNKEKYIDLKNQEEIINIAISNLEEAYEEMKTTITPKFTSSLSSSIQKISNQRYNKVTLNDENGMIVENARGEYIEANKLSTGTIDQLYLSLRLSMINDLSKENLPIILDESFAYFDNDRLEKALQYLNEQLQNHQAIILTCTNREKEILDKLNISYNILEL